MDTLKSLASFWCTLALTLSDEFDEPSGVSPRDLHRVVTRSEGEGLSFLTTTMPALAKDVYKSFQDGYIVIRSRFATKGVSSLPVFLNAVFRKIYSPDGRLLEDPSTPHVKLLLQLLGVFYKLESDKIPSEQAIAVQEKFVMTQKRIKFFPPLEQRSYEHYCQLELARKLVWEVLRTCDPLDIQPRHGSGATACRSKQWEKWNQPLRYNANVDSFYPYTEFCVTNMTHLCDILDCGSLEYIPDYEQIARATLVPKNADSPRLISMEPRENQWIQQGQMQKLYSHIESHPLTSGYVNFRDQSINQEMAKLSSNDGDFATLDLSEASDSVSLKLVEYLFPPIWVAALKASRSHSTELPDLGPIELESFAPMGSAVCFPVEALTFWALAKACSYHGKDSVFVYGDDIICRSNTVDKVISLFSELNLIVNSSKSYWIGPFRESCGGDFFLGEDVTVVRYRKLLSSEIKARISNAAFCNQIAQRWSEKAGSRMLSLIEDKIGPIPRTTREGLPLTFKSEYVSSTDVFFKRRWSKDLQVYRHRVMSTRSVTKDHGFDGWGEISRFIIGRDCLRDIQAGGLYPFSEYTNPKQVVPAWSWREIV